MAKTSSNLRKAAVLLRSVDADTAATLLTQLSAEEAAVLREAIRGLGPIEPEEQADVLAEFRREKPLAQEPVHRGVELSLFSTEEPTPSLSVVHATKPAVKPFDFLDSAPPGMLASYLAREHAQTVAVVLSHLPPDRAAAVLAALPEKAQAEAMERLSNLGDTDSEAVAILEDELAAWLKARSGHRGRRHDAVTSILAAADGKTRDAIVATLKSRRPELAQRLHPAARERAQSPRKVDNDEYRIVRTIAKRHRVNAQLSSLMGKQPLPAQPAPTAPPCRPDLPQINFDHLVYMDSRMLAQLLGEADPNVLALALAGSKDELVERICDKMPKRIAKAFRRELRRMGPMRLSDVEDAQRAIAELAARQIALRRDATRHAAARLSATVAEPSLVLGQKV